MADAFIEIPVTEIPRVVLHMDFEEAAFMLALARCCNAGSAVEAMFLYSALSRVEGLKQKSDVIKEQMTGTVHYLGPSLQ